MRLYYRKKILDPPMGYNNHSKTKIYRSTIIIIIIVIIILYVNFKLNRIQIIIIHPIINIICAIVPI